MTPPKPQTLSPSLVVRDGRAAIEFYKRGFGAEELYRLSYDDGRVAHAELRVQDAMFSIADEHPDFGCVAPQAGPHFSTSLTLYVPDVDRAAERAVAAGGQLERPISDEFYGDRVARILDPSGHRWSLHTQREQLTPSEIEQRFQELVSKG